MNNFWARCVTGAGLLLVFGGTFIYLPTYCFSLLLVLILLEILCFEWPKIADKSFWFWLFSLIYLIVPFSLLIILNEQGNTNLLGLLFLVVPASDIGGYLVGSLFGKHKLCPQISPKKSWEGLVGSFLGVLVVLLMYRLCPAKPCAKPGEIFMFIFALVITILATTGDLFESWLKRQSHLKDSGNLLPGHGGFLDRFDSFIFVTYFFYILTKLPN